MVTTEDDNRIVIQPALLQHVQQPPDAVINVADGAIIRAPCPLDLLVAEILVPEIADFKESFAVRVLVFLCDLDLGQVNINTLVTIPVLLFNRVRVVGVCERDLGVAC